MRNGGLGDFNRDEYRCTAGTVISTARVGCSISYRSRGGTGQRAVVQAFQEAGLAAKKPSPMTRDDYGLGPLVGEGTRFLIPSLGPDAGGRVIVGTPEDMNKLADYYVSLGEESAAFFSHVFRSKDGSVVVQINGELPDKQAEEYESVVESL